MTLSEVCEKYNVSEAAFKKNFNKYQDSILKKYGVRIIKEGRGSKAVYKEILENDKRALTIFEEDKVLMPEDDNLLLPSFDFITFIGLCSTPMLVFRGTNAQFLEYLGLQNTSYNRKNLKQSLNVLQEKEYILPVKEDEDYKIIAIKRSAEKDLYIGISLIRDFKQLADQHWEKSGYKWINLLKTYLYISNKAKKNLIFTLGEMESELNMSKYTIRESIKILEKDERFQSTFEYDVNGDKIRCLGRSVDIKSLNKNELFKTIMIEWEK